MSAALEMRGKWPRARLIGTGKLAGGGRRGRSAVPKGRVEDEKENADGGEGSRGPRAGDDLTWGFWPAAKLTGEV
jgi:hypothetical protein